MNYLQWEKGESGLDTQAWYSRQLMPFGLPVVVMNFHQNPEGNTAEVKFGTETVRFEVSGAIEPALMLAEHEVLSLLAGAQRVMLGR